MLSYQIERELRDGSLVRLLGSYEPDPLPVHVVYPAASASSAKVRAFVDVTVPKLRAALSIATGKRGRDGRAAVAKAKHDLADQEYVDFVPNRFLPKA